MCQRCLAPTGGHPQCPPGWLAAFPPRAPFLHQMHSLAPHPPPRGAAHTPGTEAPSTTARTPTSQPDTTGSSLLHQHPRQGPWALDTTPAAITPESQAGPDGAQPRPVWHWKLTGHRRWRGSIPAAQDNTQAGTPRTQHPCPPAARATPILAPDSAPCPCRKEASDPRMGSSAPSTAEPAVLGVQPPPVCPT